MTDSDVPRVASAETFAQLAHDLHGADGVSETVDAVVRFALSAEACDFAGVALATRNGRPEISAVTDPVVRVLYELQIAADEGPMMTSLRTPMTVHVPDVVAEGRWPDWSRSAAELGVGCVLHMPMVASKQTVGVLSLYHRKPWAFSVDDEAVAHILARHASVAVATARLDATLAQAVDARKLVGQAMGILMERFDLDGDRAFAILKRYSQDTNTKLRDVAQQLVNTRSLPQWPTTPGREHEPKTPAVTS